MKVEFTWVMIILAIGYHLFLLMTGYGIAMLMMMRDNEVQKVPEDCLIVKKEYFEGLVSKLKKQSRYDNPVDI